MEPNLKSRRCSHQEASFLPPPVPVKGAPRLPLNLIEIIPARGSDVLGEFLTAKELAQLRAHEDRINATHKLIRDNCAEARRLAQRATTSEAAKLIAQGKDPAPAFAEIATMEHREVGARSALYILQADLNFVLKPILQRMLAAIAAHRAGIEKGIVDAARKLGIDIPPDHDRVLAIGALHGCIACASQKGASVGNRPSDVLGLLGFEINNIN